MDEIVSEPWGEWLQVQLDKPDSGINQLRHCGMTLDGAVMTVQLAKIFAQLLDLELAMLEETPDPPKEPWEQEDE